VRVVGLCGVYRDHFKTAVRVAHLDGSRRLRSGRAWRHRISGSYRYSQTGARIARVSLLPKLRPASLRCPALDRLNKCDGKTAPYIFQGDLPNI
jgi:hypothetical protein